VADYVTAIPNSGTKTKKTIYRELTISHLIRSSDLCGGDCRKHWQVRSGTSDTDHN